MNTSQGRWVLGIDLGTTNTAAVAFGPNGEGPMAIRFGRNRPILPSVVSFKNPALPLVGWLARDMQVTDPLTTIHGWKRFVGRTERSEYVSRHRNRFPFRIHTDPQGQLGAVIGNRVISFVEIAGLVLDQVRLQASAALRTDVRNCVITVPAHFANHQRKAVLMAGRQAGLNVMRLVNEPTAAALAFGINQRLDTRVLVFDLGGGTFDTTVLEVTDNIFDVKATRGDGFLGGADFDKAVRDRLVELCNQRHRVDISEEPIVSQRVLNASENAKCALSVDTSFPVRIPMIGHDRRGRMFDLEYTLTREELERLTAPIVERTIGIVDEMLTSAKVQVKDIHHVIVVGGQSKMPLVKQRIEDVLSQSPLSHLDPETAIAHGAALVAKSEGTLDGAVLLDVLSVPIGAVFPGGQTVWLFEANARLPAKSRVPLAPPAGGGDLSIGVWQGLDVTSSERQVLGVIKISGAMFQGQHAQLELTLREDLELEAAFEGSSGRHWLQLTPP